MNETIKNIVQDLATDFFNRSLDFPVQKNYWKSFTWDLQADFLDVTIKSPVLKKYPVNSEYTKLFFKKIISILEDYELDIHDGFYDCLCFAMQSKPDSEFHYRHYLIKNNLKDVIVIKETKNMVVNGTTGMRTWEAALMLADWAICNKNIFNNKKVLELGAGIGFTGITIAKHCNPQSIILTDCHTDVLKTIEDNITINFPNSINDHRLVTSDGLPEIGSMMLDWNNLEELPKHLVPDVLIGADIVYDPSILSPLCKVIQYFLKRNIEIDIYIASVIRNEQTFETFKDMLNSMGFSIDIFKHAPAFIKWDSHVKRCFLKITNKQG